MSSRGVSSSKKADGVDGGECAAMRARSCSAIKGREGPLRRATLASVLRARIRMSPSDRTAPAGGRGRDEEGHNNRW